VIARTSSFAFRSRAQDLRTIGQRLRVATVLDGTVRRAGNRIRVTAQLICAADEQHLWSDRYDREMTDIFAIQDEISQAIADALKVHLAATTRPTSNVEAYQHYLHGLYWFQRYTRRSLPKAREGFEQAIRHDPAFAPPYAGLALFYFGMGALGVQRMSEMAPLAASAARNALTIDAGLSEAHSILGTLAGAVDFDWKLSEHHHRLALAAEPAPPLNRVRYGLYFLTPLGRVDDAVAQYRRALETDPLSMMVHFVMSFALYSKGQYEDAVRHAAAAVDLYPDYWLVHFAMGLALLQQGRLEESIASLETTLRLSPSFTHAAGFLAAAYIRSGGRARADALMQEIGERAASQDVSPVCFATCQAALGQADRMLEFLDAAFADRNPYLTRMDAEPCFAPYRSDPRYRDLMLRMNLGAAGVPAAS